MAYDIGPNTFLPGRVMNNTRPHGVCDNHPDRPSIADIVGETGSFGSEVGQYCQECYDRITAQMKKEAEESLTEVKYCEIHKGEGSDVRLFRDPDEGSRGRLYNACQKCRTWILTGFNDEDNT